MAPDFTVADHKSHISKITRLKKSQHLFMQAWLRHLNPYIQHPDIVEREFTVIAAEHIQLTFHDIGGVTAARPWLVITCRNLLPVIGVDVKHMHIIHPVNTVITAKVKYFGVY